jgi:Protein of unknown function (DUF3153)
MKIIGGENRFGRFIDRLMNSIARQLAIVFWAIAIGLSGCVKYDTGVHFASLNSGEIVEHIQIGEQLNSFSQNAVKTWLASIEQRTKQAQGQLRRLNDREVEVVIPFNNAQELVSKIDRYFNPNLPNTQLQSRSIPQENIAAGESQFNSHMQVNQNNFLLVVRNQLIYDVDLRSLQIATTDPKVSVASDNFINLHFSIQSPWGVKNGDATSNVASVDPSNKQLSWQLKPGEINHVEAIFWLPNPLGIGAILIIIISIAGYYLKYRQLPMQSSG